MFIFQYNKHKISKMENIVTNIKKLIISDKRGYKLLVGTNVNEKTHSLGVSLTNNTTVGQPKSGHNTNVMSCRRQYSPV